MTDAVLFRPSPQYTESVRFLASRAGLDRNHLLQGVKQILGFGLEAKDDPALRNRLWMDATRLLLQEWSDDPNLKVLDLDALQAQRRKVEAALGTDAPSELGALTEAVIEGTYRNFGEFMSSGRFVKPGDGEDWLHAYSLWFERHQPYLLVDLPQDDGQVDAEINRRVAWMVGNLPQEVLRKEGLHDVFADRAWRFVRGHVVLSGGQQQADSPA